MPLGFDSISHGSIAFGFFNIESDLLLLENYFLFADEFCRNIEALPDAAAESGSAAEWEVWHIPDRKDRGDLMSAMHGVSSIGFFGELYQKHPFPASWDDFKQKPEGEKTQTEVKQILQKYGKIIPIRFGMEAGGRRVHIGAYSFTNAVFGELIKYVWEGGYPKWRDGKRPEYVMHMREWITSNNKPMFAGLALV
ncbi:MAG: hypothetical protein V2B19_13100 [Pseudomonadota bacterium]